MSFKEFNSALRDLDQGARAMKKAQKLERVLKERKQRTHQLTIAAEEMQKRGASQSSIRRFVEAYNEYLIITNKPAKPDTSDPTPVPNSESPGLLLSEVETQEITWLWEKRIPRGKITVLDGDPGMSKSLIAAHIAACVSTGRPMPDGTPGKQGGVILIAPEDSPEETLKPRLEAAGGDPSQVLLLNTVEDLDAKRRKMYDRPFSLAQDLDLLENAIDSSRDQSVREVFTPLAQLAERTGCAILMIRHLSRGMQDIPSIAVPALSASSPPPAVASSSLLIPAMKIGACLPTPNTTSANRPATSPIRW